MPARKPPRDAYAFVAPALLAMAAVIVFPLLYTAAASLFEVTLRRPGFGDFVGLGQYVKSILHPQFQKATWVTLVFTVTVVALEFLLGLGVALLLNRNVRGKAVFLSILIVPMLLTPVAVGLVWRMLLHPQTGIINYVLTLLHLPAPAWLGNPKLALFTVVLVDVWQQAPFMLLILMAGLVSLPKEPFEAAAIDGATGWQTFWRITWPLLQPTIVITLLIRAITALKTYDLVYVLTKGGPGTTTEVLSYYIYRVAFTRLDIGWASAQAMLLLIATVILSAFVVRRSLGAARA